nr:hypothetical protein [Trentepohlia sp. YN1317]
MFLGLLPVGRRQTVKKNINSGDLQNTSFEILENFMKEAVYEYHHKSHQNLSTSGFNKKNTNTISPAQTYVSQFFITKVFSLSVDLFPWKKNRSIFFQSRVFASENPSRSLRLFPTAKNVFSLLVEDGQLRKREWTDSLLPVGRSFSR